MTDLELITGNLCWVRQQREAVRKKMVASLRAASRAPGKYLCELHALHFRYWLKSLAYWTSEICHDEGLLRKIEAGEDWASAL